MSLNEFEKVVNEFKEKKTFTEEDCDKFISEMKKLNPKIVSDNLTDLMDSVNNLSDDDRSNHWLVKMMSVTIKSYVKMTRFICDIIISD